MIGDVKKLGHECLRLLGSPTETYSFLGGLPIVCQEIKWPENNEEPLSFIAQLDLSEINADQCIDWLPKQGRLLFFYDLEECPWGFDPKDKNGWAVIYENGSEEPFEQPLPLNIDPESIAPEIKYLRSSRFTSYPDLDRLDISYTEISDEDHCDYYEFIANNYGDDPYHQVGGYPKPVQNDSMEEECQLVSGGVYCGEPEGFTSEKEKHLRDQPNDWKLLLQFDSDDDVEVMWGDCGRLYIWVRESDAKQCNFDNSWMIMQCS
ncbi:YwqG family protein [Microbulbifer variabilis]|uniref:YwqG family protein n=1 Tax=Microbulbifer variabilis TaxID=266805 RepID=UPI001CFE1C12|nr:YwqG family protein [Microbulbifer variabilis]